MSSSSRESNADQPSPFLVHKDSNITINSIQPVIIYTHPPKIIHAKACDFKAIVQKLTGNPCSADDDDINKHPPPPLPAKNAVVPCSKKKRKALYAAAKKNEGSVKSLEGTSQFRPLYQPPDFEFELDHLQTESPPFLQEFTPELNGSPDLIYRYNEMLLGSSPPVSNMESSTLTFYDLLFH